MANPSFFGGIGGAPRPVEPSLAPLFTDPKPKGPPLALSKGILEGVKKVNHVTVQAQNPALHYGLAGLAAIIATLAALVLAGIATAATAYLAAGMTVAALILLTIHGSQAIKQTQKESEQAVNDVELAATQTVVSNFLDIANRQTEVLRKQQGWWDWMWRQPLEA